MNKDSKSATEKDAARIGTECQFWSRAGIPSSDTVDCKYAWHNLGLILRAIRLGGGSKRQAYLQPTVPDNGILMKVPLKISWHSWQLEGESHIQYRPCEAFRSSLYKEIAELKSHYSYL